MDAWAIVNNYLLYRFGFVIKNAIFQLKVTSNACSTSNIVNKAKNLAKYLHKFSLFKSTHAIKYPYNASKFKKHLFTKKDSI